MSYDPDISPSSSSYSASDISSSDIGWMYYHLGNMLSLDNNDNPLSQLFLGWWIITELNRSSEATSEHHPMTVM